MSLTIYKIAGKEIIPTDEYELEKNKIYIIVDKQVKRTKIWIWSGPNTSNKEKYFAGVSATKIKSSQRLYGANIEVVERGNEPESFPIFSKNTKIVKPKSPKPVSFEENIGEEFKEVEFQKSTPIEIQGQSITDEKNLEVKKVDIKEIKVLLNDITKNLKNITSKIDDFLDNI